jgi:3-hydroxypropanoate dehydrogenase
MSAAFDPTTVDPPTLSIDDIVELKAARALDDRALRTLFLEARSANGFLPVPVPHSLIERIFELAELGPTSANTLPLRILFVETPEAKARLIPTLSPANVEKTKSAPVTAIFAADLKFFEHIPRLFPHAPQFKDFFAGDEKAEAATQFALTQATLQGAYFTLAARALGLDVGPLGGFDRPALDAEFFPDGTVKSLWLANLGYGDDSKVFPRLPRFGFDEVARFL